MRLRTYLQASLATVVDSVEDSVGALEVVAVFDLTSGFAELACAPKWPARGFAVGFVERQTGRGILCEGKVSYF